VEMDRKPSRKNGEVKINARERCETERDAKKIQSFHEEVYDAVSRLKELQGYKANPF